MDTHDLHHSARLLLNDSLSRRASRECGLEMDVRDGSLWLSRRATRYRAVALAALTIGAVLLTLPLTLPDLLPHDLATTAVKTASVFFGGVLILTAFYLPFSKVNVRISRAEIERIRCWSGIPFGKRSVRPADVEDLEIGPGRQGAAGVSYALFGRGAFGRFKLVDGVPDRLLLEALRRQIMLAAGIRPAGTH